MIKSYKQIHFSYLFLLILVLENANVPPKLKFCVGGREVLSDDSSVSDRLINGSIDTGKHLKYEIKGTCYYNICELAISWKIEGFDQLLPEQRSFLQRKTKVLFLLKKKKKQYLIMQSLSISLKEVLWIICKVIYRQENC